VFGYKNITDQTEDT